MSPDPSASLCTVTPLGVVIRNGHAARIAIAEEYRPALHRLGEFGHIVVMLPAGDRRDLSPLQRMRAAHRARPILLATAQLLGVDEQRGLVDLDRLEARTGDPIWDIKPYLPSEDGIRTVTLSGAAAGSGDWRPEAAAAALRGWPEAPALDPAATELEPIGQVRTVGRESRLELPGLDARAWKTLALSSHLRVIWWFDRTDRPHFRRILRCHPPYESSPRTGVFATRSPVRVYPLALDVARVLSLDPRKKTIVARGLEAMDNTPVLDVQPYIPELDRVRETVVPVPMRHWPPFKDDDDQPGPAQPPLRASGAERLAALVRSEAAEASFAPFAAEEEAPTDLDAIEVTGARQNNLKGLSCRIPLRRLTVVTGVSGCGKSSLAFDTLFAESQRRFMDSLSTLGRQAFEQLETADVDRITNLPPAVAIEQKTIGRNPRSTVGTMTEVYDFLRLLYARLGTRHCPSCGRAVTALGPDAMVRLIGRLPPGTRFAIRAHGAAEGEELVAPAAGLDATVRRALAAGSGALVLALDGEELVLQTGEACVECRRPFFTLSSSVFSFNHPAGMCPDCRGLGVRLTTDPALIVTAPERSILDGASPWWGDLRQHQKKPTGNWMKSEVLALAASMNVDLQQPWKELPEAFRNRVLFGTGDQMVRWRFTMAHGRSGTVERPVAGAVANIERLFRDTSSEGTRDFYLRFMSERPCPACGGERLGPVGRLTTFAGKRYPEASRLSIAELAAWVEEIPRRLDERQAAVAGDILRELHRRLRSLVTVGVSYLTLDRTAPTLSGGEAQRLRLARQLGGGLTNLLYVLDEPSIGLHPRDHARMLVALRRLQRAGNTVLVVEHDADTMRAADWLIDLGPGAGEAGGRLVAQGTPPEVMSNPASLTGQYLSGARRVTEPTAGRQAAARYLVLHGASLNTLRNVTARFPLGLFTCVTGVSGSGKSSLVAHTLYPALARALHQSEEKGGPFLRLDGLAEVDKVVNVTQAPIGRTPRSNPATYTGIFDDIRELFAATDEARKREWKPNRFSFNAAEGRCDACSGDGRQRIEMHFMPDVWVTCPSCHGRRFNDETLAVRWQGRTIAEVLELDVGSACALFGGIPALARPLAIMNEVGLGYLRLGQSALTLSGGEAQRIKLARELARPDTGRTVYILDEPTSGLHLADIRCLLGLIRRITDAGNTVIVIEHNLDMIASADWVIDLGPEGGAAGGTLTAEGTPEDVARVDASHTGRCLKERLG